MPTGVKQFGWLPTEAEDPFSKVSDDDSLGISGNNEGNSCCDETGTESKASRCRNRANHIPHNGTPTKPEILSKTP